LKSKLTKITYILKGMLHFMKRVFWSAAAILMFLYLITIPVGHSAIRIVTGTVIKVSDGDSIHISTPEQTKLKVRLYGIDAPETPKINNRTRQINKPGQPYDEDSWKALQDKIMGKQVKVDIIEFDKYRRAVCMVWLDDRNINIEMVREGYAEAFIEYLKPPYRAQFLESEQEARKARRGIWSIPDYERPRDFRKRLKVSGGD